MSSNELTPQKALNEAMSAAHRAHTLAPTPDAAYVEIAVAETFIHIAEALADAQLKQANAAAFGPAES